MSSFLQTISQLSPASLVNNVLNWLVNLLPTSDGLSTEVSASLNTIFGYIASFNLLFPFDVMFKIISYVLFFEITFLTYKIIRFALNFARGSGG